jgi:hypothetical protein
MGFSQAVSRFWHHVPVVKPRGKEQPETQETVSGKLNSLSRSRDVSCQGTNLTVKDFIYFLSFLISRLHTYKSNLTADERK